MKNRKSPLKLRIFCMTNEDIIVVDEDGKEFALGAACEEFRKTNGNIIGGTE